jgi:hypothetical protein
MIQTPNINLTTRQIQIYHWGIIVFCVLSFSEFSCRRGSINFQNFPRMVANMSREEGGI